MRLEEGGDAGDDLVLPAAVVAHVDHDPGGAGGDEALDRPPDPLLGKEVAQGGELELDLD